MVSYQLKNKQINNNYKKKKNPPEEMPSVVVLALNLVG